jgi:dolichol-phosphate mannosyltransferase
VKLSIVIPARNEAANIGPTVDRIRDRLRGEGIAYDMVVVDEGSSNATADQVRARAGTDPGIRLLRNDGLRGFGYAVRRGLEAFTGDAVAIVMADGSDSPDDLVRYYYIVRARAECACPVRCGQPGESDRQPVRPDYCSVSGPTT